MVKVMMEWTYSTAKRPSAIFVSDWLDARDALAIAEDLEKAGRLKDADFKDEVGTSWTRKELKKLLAEVEEEPQDVTAYFDGGYLKGEMAAGIGSVLYYRMGKKRWRIRSNARLESFDSNNEAEYAAFYETLNQMEELGVHHQRCVFRGDSLVVLNQLAGEWPCMEENLNRWLDRIEKKMEHLHIIPVYEPVQRKANQEADRLATLALKGEKIHSKFEITE